MQEQLTAAAVRSMMQVSITGGQAMEQRFSASGRVELGGNHTDHQHGCVLAAAIDLAMQAEASPNGSGVLRVFSEGYEPVAIPLE